MMLGNETLEKRQRFMELKAGEVAMKTALQKRKEKEYEEQHDCISIEFLFYGVL